MARLVVKFESQVLREIAVQELPFTIGRAADNDLQIDNLAVSDHHARLYAEGQKVMIEDLGSLNGTSVNGAHVQRTALRDGDNIQIGNHQLQIDTVYEASTTIADGVSGGRKMPAADSEEDSIPAVNLMHAPTLRVLRGRTDQGEYLLAGKLTVIGSSEMATVKLLGWLAPVVGAQINHHPDGYYLGMGDSVPKVNGQPIQSPTLLRDGDIIEVGRVRLQFSSPD
jgi:hypothetical protein